MKCDKREINWNKKLKLFCVLWTFWIFLILIAGANEVGTLTKCWSWSEYSCSRRYLIVTQTLFFSTWHTTKKNHRQNNYQFFLSNLTKVDLTSFTQLFWKKKRKKLAANKTLEHCFEFFFIHFNSYFNINKMYEFSLFSDDAIQSIFVLNIDTNESSKTYMKFQIRSNVTTANRWLRWGTKERKLFVFFFVSFVCVFFFSVRYLFLNSTWIKIGFCLFWCSL